MNGLLWLLPPHHSCAPSEAAAHCIKKHDLAGFVMRPSCFAVARTSGIDSAEYLGSDEAVSVYMEDALQSDDPAFIAHALGLKISVMPLAAQ